MNLFFLRPPWSKLLSLPDGTKPGAPTGEAGAQAEPWGVPAKSGWLSSLLGLVLSRDSALRLSLVFQAQEDTVGPVK